MRPLFRYDKSVEFENFLKNEFSQFSVDSRALCLMSFNFLRLVPKAQFYSLRTYLSKRKRNTKIRLNVVIFEREVQTKTITSTAS